MVLIGCNKKRLESGYTRLFFVIRCGRALRAPQVFQRASLLREE